MHSRVSFKLNKITESMISKLLSKKLIFGINLEVVNSSKFGSVFSGNFFGVYLH